VERCGIKIASVMRVMDRDNIGIHGKDVIIGVMCVEAVEKSDDV